MTRQEKQCAADGKAIDIAWAAGIIDGEGCLFIARKKYTTRDKVLRYTYSLGLKVTMGHEPTILRLRRMFGSGSKHKVEQVGWNPAYTWLVQSRLCEKVLATVGPYLFTKRAELQVAKRFLKLPGWYGGRFRGVKSNTYQAKEYKLWDEMRRLKPRTRFRLARNDFSFVDGLK